MYSRFLPSGVVLAILRNFLTSSVVAKVIKSKNVVAGACESTCDVVVGWLQGLW